MDLFRDSYTSINWYLFVKKWPLKEITIDESAPKLHSEKITLAQIIGVLLSQTSEV